MVSVGSVLLRMLVITGMAKVDVGMFLFPNEALDTGADFLPDRLPDFLKKRVHFASSEAPGIFPKLRLMNTG